MTTQTAPTPTQYKLRNGLTVALDAQGRMAPVMIERVLMTYYGFSEELAEDGKVAIWRDMESGVRAHITARAEMTADELVEFGKVYECQPMNVLTDAALAQALVKDVALQITPMAFRDGSLVGTWNVARISRFNPMDFRTNGVVTGIDQPVGCDNINLLLAIFGTACRVMGIGKEAYVLFNKGAEGNADIVSCDPSLAWQFQEYLDKQVFRAPELDAYMTSVVPEDVKVEAIAVARTKCRAAMAEAEQDAAQAVDEEASSATKAMAPKNKA